MGKGHVIRERYEATARGYDELYRAEQYEKYSVSLPKAPPRGRVLDAGCGTGLLAEYMRAMGYLSRVHEYVCLDYSIAMLRIAAWRLKHTCPSKCHVVAGNVMALPFPDNHFDIVYSYTVLDLVDDPLKAAEELARVSRGPVVISMLKTLPYKDLFIEAKARILAISPKDVIFILE